MYKRIFHHTGYNIDTTSPQRESGSTMLSTTVTAPKNHGCSSCYRKFGSPDALANHQKDKHKKIVGNHRCSVCNKSFKGLDDVAHHKRDKHEKQKCSSCGQPFNTKSQLAHHQKAKNHCFCKEHQFPFSSAQELKKHQRTMVHVTGFGCLTCQKDFNDGEALVQHMYSTGHAIRINAAAEKNHALQRELENLRCEPCKRSFKDHEAWRKHKASIKHNPLSDMNCPLSSKCSVKFNSPSAMLLHLESGTC